MEIPTLFVDVLLPLPVPGLFTYRVPRDMNSEVSIGKRVVVQFGRSKIYTALVRNIHQKIPKDHTPKYILSVLDDFPVVNTLQFDFWKWISEYYMSTLGEVMNVALPSALKLASESKVILNPDFDGDLSSLNDKEYLITEALEMQNTLTLSEVSDIVEQKKIIPLIKNLIEKGVVLTHEELHQRYKPKSETYIYLSDEFNDESKLKEVFDELDKRAFKQLELLISYIQITKFPTESGIKISRPELLKKADASAAQLNSLVKKGIFQTRVEEKSRLPDVDAEKKATDIILSKDQSKALKQIKEGFNDKDVNLLHGVTSSGKTEIYIKLIDEVISSGKQVLYLLPEIALTTQIISRLRKYFGDKIGIYHSRYSENERIEIWNSVLNNSKKDDSKQSKYQVILGPRSTLFLPYNNLGLVIVDEEHDSSYKQYDPAPRYNARDSAIYLAQLHNSKTLLGSATPSVESYFNAQSGKYSFIELFSRYGDISLPEIKVVDIKEESRRKRMNSYFSETLLDEIKKALTDGEQIILFQNRRGFSPRLECENCNWTPECKNCDVTLVYHKHFNNMRCHYCGYSTRLPEKCPVCSDTKILMKGFGTEKIEDELPVFFPDVRIVRMDLDTTRSKNAYQNIISDFEERKINILVGTQMITKGLDFDNVGIVGVLNADNMINFPDFRAFERSFQILAQVSGRAGRKKKGKVIIQTYKPQHSVITNVIDNNYSGMYLSQLQERQKFKYPPYYRLILLKLKHKDPKLLNQGAAELAQQLRDKFGKRVLGPEYPMISRIKNLYIKNILIKIEKGSSISKSKEIIIEQIENFKKHSDVKQVRVQVDVDPV